MVLRLMLASAATLALGAAALLAQPELPAEHVATRAEFIAAHPRPAAIFAASCEALPAPRTTPADI